MIVKITIFFAVILFVWFFGMKMWFSEHPKEAIQARILNEYPKWFIAWVHCFLVEVVLAIISIFWFLFLR